MLNPRETHEINKPRPTTHEKNEPRPNTHEKNEHQPTTHEIKQSPTQNPRKRKKPAYC